MPAYTAKCHAPGCITVGDCARGFCARHWKEFRAACIANGSWSRATKLPSPIIPKFEYEGDEQALIEMTEQQEREEKKQ